MNKKMIVSLLALMFLLVSTALCFAEGPNGNKRKGKYTYRKVYKACAARGEVDSKKPHISPSDKTMAQWERIFDTRDFSEFKCGQEWGALTDEETQDIYAYLYGYAADSPSPATCK
ncbi:MAG: cytochrome c family protein [Desulfobacterium sp.]|nr:cytochrome c family protein [Desulfobacterium sp.]